MVVDRLIDRHLNAMHYLIYDGNCFVCRLCANVCKRIFVNTVFVTYESFKKHWGMFPYLINKCNPATVNLLTYSDKEWLYGDDALVFICVMNNQPSNVWLCLYNIASKFRKKCSKCKLSSED